VRNLCGFLRAMSVADQVAISYHSLVGHGMVQTP
jgi:hypothetical protein